ncbi:hypothetical protein RJ640_011778 [Escallonia rubra]|uniref:Light-regulated protein n=1 Tax=Escallonia rubra TaxID=112253 RepID=A0AA88U488_9ASTE|nr:hypothetical protein RJ640_011778 [Escallonia rubra]
MQAALTLRPSSLPLLAPSRTMASPARSLHTLQTSRCLPNKQTAVVSDTSTADYSSITSVFPAEACETVGGEACDAEMYPEVKLKPETSNKAKTALESEDRDYLEYNNPRTVFPGEACDDLGGEFCEPEYQKGVY